jgi:outer membrane translocation and assembly module TamA
MRIAAAILTLFFFASPGHSQSATQPPQAEVQIRSLKIVSDDLPQADRERVMRSLQGQAYFPNEFEERTRMSLRNLGYYNARVDDATLSEIREEKAGKSADVSVNVEPGAQYRLGFIQFKHATIFPPDQLRSQFPIQTGSLFSAGSVGYGLEKLKNLYQDKGYINFGAVPVPGVDESRHIVDLTIDLDEGQLYVFGHLILDGVEPRAGAGKALIESWASLQGKTYSPELLKVWLASNWPPAAQNAYSVRTAETDPRQVNVFLRFPENQPRMPGASGPGYPQTGPGLSGGGLTFGTWK